MEMMGRKSGFYATDEDQEAMRKQMDSMMRSRPQSRMDYFWQTHRHLTKLFILMKAKKLPVMHVKKHW